MIEVVAGVLVRDGRILMGQRPSDKTFPFAWECPGGKREAGESHEDTLKREWWEEFRLDVRRVAETPLWAGEVNAGSPVSIVFFDILELECFGIPRPTEGQGFGWFTPEEMRALVLTPGNMAAMPALPHVAKIVFPECDPVEHKLIDVAETLLKPFDSDDYRPDQAWGNVFQAWLSRLASWRVSQAVSTLQRAIDKTREGPAR